MMCLITVPKKIYVAVAEADSITELNAFDACLVKIGLPNVSLIKVTSLLPSDVEIVKEPPKFPHGANVPSIYATVTSKRKGEIIRANFEDIYRAMEEAEVSLSVVFPSSYDSEDLLKSSLDVVEREKLIPFLRFNPNVHLLEETRKIEEKS